MNATNLELFLIQNKKRIEILEKRIEKLIELNSRHRFVNMIFSINGLFENPKCDKYLNLLLKIKTEIAVLKIKNKQINEELFIQSVIDVVNDSNIKRPISRVFGSHSSTVNQIPTNQWK